MGAFDRIDKQFQNKPTTIQLECYKCGGTKEVKKTAISTLPYHERGNTIETTVPLCEDCRIYCAQYWVSL